MQTVCHIFMRLIRNKFVFLTSELVKIRANQTIFWRYTFLQAAARFDSSNEVRVPWLMIIVNFNKSWCFLCGRLPSERFWWRLLGFPCFSKICVCCGWKTTIRLWGCAVTVTVVSLEYGADECFFWGLRVSEDHDWRIARVLFFTASIKNKRNDVLYLDLANWEFVREDRWIQKMPRSQWPPWS